MILSYGLGVVLTPSFLQNSHGTLIILAMELGKRFIRNPELPIRWFHQGILPVEVAQVFGNTAPAGKTHCLAGRTHCSPCIIHKLNVFHIHQKVWEIIFFSSVLLFLLLAISHPLSRHFHLQMNPDLMRSCVSLSLSEIPYLKSFGQDYTMFLMLWPCQLEE